jgi:hypothetical protein
MACRSGSASATHNTKLNIITTVTSPHLPSTWLTHSLFSPDVLFTFRINGFSDFVHRPDSKELEEKHDVSETGSVSVRR